MRSFGGEFSRSQKVSLSGKSKQVESREEVLQRTRLEREQRKQHKLEQKSALLIQSTWRAHSARQQARDEIRSRWISQYGYNGEHATIQDILDTNSFFLPAIIFFAHQPTDINDVHRLARACSLAIATDTTRNNNLSTPSICSPSILNNTSMSDDDDTSQHAIHRSLQRAQALTRLSLHALTLHRNALLADLKAPYKRPDASQPLNYTSIALPLVDCIMSCISVESWKDLLGQSNAKTVAVKSILENLVYSQSSPGLFEQLAAIVSIACDIVVSSGSNSNNSNSNNSNSNSITGTAARRGPPTTAETLCTNLIVRYIAMYNSDTSRTTRKKESLPVSLFCVPSLTHRCPSLLPVYNRLWKIVILQLYQQRQQQQHDGFDLITWITNSTHSSNNSTHNNTDDDSIISAALLSLLANLVEGVTAALQQEETSTSTAIITSQQQQNVSTSTTDSVVVQQAIQRYQTLGLEFINIASIVLSYKPISITIINNNTASLITSSNNSNNNTNTDNTDSRNSKVCSMIVKALTDPILLTTVLKSALPIEYYNSNNTSSTNSNTIIINANTTTTTNAAVHAVCTFLDILLNIPDQKQKIMLTASLRCNLVARLWYYYFKPLLITNTTGGNNTSDGALLHNRNNNTTTLLSTTTNATINTSTATSHITIDPGWMYPLCLFAESFSTCIIISGDPGLYQRQEPLPLSELYNTAQPSLGVLSLLRAALWYTLWIEPQQQQQQQQQHHVVLPTPLNTTNTNISSSMITTQSSSSSEQLRSRMNHSVGNLMAQLHKRNGRRSFAPPEAFYADGLPAERFFLEISSGVLAGLDANDPGSSRAWTLLAHAPFLVPFFERARVFQRLVAAERSRYRESSQWDGMFGGGGGAPRQFVSVRRGHELEDAYGTLGVATSETLRGQVRISFISEHGMDEAGVDGGGLFKEFLEGVVKNGFDPGMGLFKATSDNKLYPNPHAVRAVPHAMVLLEFLGKMVGKALWEGILLELPLASFFLKKFRGMVCDVDDLPSLDPQLARSLFSLKEYQDGDVSDLGLTFSVTDNVLGQPVEVDLIPGGKDIPVTSSNAALFIHRVAEFKLNTQLKEPTAAFLRGFYALIPQQWIEMFNDRELQELIGGAEDGAALNLNDLKAHVQYAAGYSADHPVITSFWEAMATLTPPQQANFLRFVTSCPRPPLLGFAYLEPPLTIQMAGSGDDGVERLPTAATCMNLLKLPPYRGGAVQIRDKLLYAIESGAGFDLS